MNFQSVKNWLSLLLPGAEMCPSIHGQSAEFAFQIKRRSQGIFFWVGTTCLDPREEIPTGSKSDQKDVGVLKSLWADISF